jgi:hypothetical protein
VLLARVKIAANIESAVFHSKTEEGWNLQNHCGGFRKKRDTKEPPLRGRDQWLDTPRCYRLSYGREEVAEDFFGGERVDLVRLSAMKG